MNLLVPDFKPHAFIARIKGPLVDLEIYNVVPPFIKNICMGIACGLKVLNSLLEHFDSLFQHVTPAFQS